MTITHQIASSAAAMVPGGDIISQLSGLIGQASALSTAGVGLPGIQSIGSQIAALGSAITAAGGASGSATDTSGISSTVSALGTSLSAITSLSSASSLITSLTGQLTSLTSMINPSGSSANIIHSHILDAAKGIIHSAFQGKHTVNLGTGGIDINSASKVAHSAPSLPHNGPSNFSDFVNIAKTLGVTQGVTGASFSMFSDARLKTNINAIGSVLDRLLQCRVKTFDVQAYDIETGKIVDEPPTPSLGLIAQELFELFPELVRSGSYLSIDIDKLIMILLAGFIEFAAETRDEIAELRAEIAEMKQ